MKLQKLYSRALIIKKPLIVATEQKQVHAFKRVNKSDI